MTDLQPSVVAVPGSPGIPSKTAALADRVAAAVGAQVPLQYRRIDVYQLGPGFTGARNAAELPAPVAEQLRAAERAALVIAASPVFRGSYTGMFKHFFDLIDPHALTGTPVLLVATGGSDRHTLVLEHQFRPLFGFFRALTLPTTVYASTADFDADNLLNPEIAARIDAAAHEATSLLGLHPAYAH
jgi:FMN reductase